MKPINAVRALLLALSTAAGVAAAPAFAQINFNISVAPPAPQYETIPSVAPGYVWAPGYWGWNGDRHVWVRGRSIVQRAGYRWEPDRWEQRERVYYRYPGRWERDTGVGVVKVKKEKKPKDWHGDKGGHGKGGKHRD